MYKYNQFANLINLVSEAETKLNWFTVQCLRVYLKLIFIINDCRGDISLDNAK